jgi:hypothetical protein
MDEAFSKFPSQYRTDIQLIKKKMIHKNEHFGKYLKTVYTLNSKTDRCKNVLK